jgi:DNA-binding FadR family transcriptional regulator
MRGSGGDPSGSLSWFVTAELGRAIVGGAYLPGATLPNEEALCAGFAVGRGAVREAVKMLAAKGLVESRPRRGTTVLPVPRWSLFDGDVQAWLQGGLQAGVADLALLRELLEARLAFEPAAAALAAGRAGAEGRAAIAAAFARMEAAARGRDDPYAADLAFHAAIVAAGGNRFFAGLQPAIATALVLSFRATNAARGDRVGDLAAHRRVLEAVLAGDGAAAAAATRGLLSDVERVIGALGAAQDEYRGETDADGC